MVKWALSVDQTMTVHHPHKKTASESVPTNDQRPNSGMREGNMSHAEVNAALLSYEKTVIFGQQNRLRNGILMPDEKLTRFHAGHELVRFFYQGMNKLPEYILDALLEYNVSVTLITGKELLVFKNMRQHQAFHIGFTRKTIYIPEGIIREAINKGWDSWAISEAIIRESWPLMDYLLIFEFIRRAQLRLRSHVTLGSQTTIQKALRFLNKHLLENETAEDDDFRAFFRHYSHHFYKIDRKILDRDPYDLADQIYDEKQERLWSDIKVDAITSAFEFPSYFDLDRDIIHPAAYEAAAIRNQSTEPETVDDILHDICDAARFKILRQTKTNTLLNQLILFGRPGFEGIIDVAAEENATGIRHLTDNQGDGYDTITEFKIRLSNYSTTGPEGVVGSICHDFRDLLNYQIKRQMLAQFHKFQTLPLPVQKENKGYLKNLLLKMIPLKEPKKQAEHRKQNAIMGTAGSGAASERETELQAMLTTTVYQARTLKKLIEIAEQLIGPEDPETKHKRTKAILQKLDKHPRYHTLIRDQLRNVTGNQKLSLGDSIQEQVDTLFRSIPKHPYRLSSDPSYLRACLKEYDLLRKQNPNSRKVFTHLAGIFIRLDKTNNYNDHIDKIRLIGPEAKPALEYIIDHADTYDFTRQPMLQTARELLKSMS